MRDLPSIAAVNRHHASRIRRRKLRQFFRAVTPRIDVGRVLIEGTPSHIAETANCSIANRERDHRHG